jgi:beta-glucosidase
MKTVAVIGPNADAPVIGGGGSAKVVPYHVITPLEGISAALGKNVKVSYVPAVTNGPVAATADARYFSPAKDRETTGLTARYYQGQDFKSTPLKTETDRIFYKLGFGAGVAAKTKGNFSIRWEGYFFPPRTGEYSFSLVSTGKLTLTIDGKPVITPASKAMDSPILSFFPIKMREGSIKLEAGHAYPIRLDYEGSSAESFRVLSFGMRAPTGTIDEAVAGAKLADAAIVFVGSSDSTETEGSDRTSLDLYGDQNALVEAVLAANPNTVVVVNAGAPVTMPWADKAKAILLEWLPGQEAGYAVADVLLGKVDPSGHLPGTFPKRYEDNPTYLFYPGTRSAYYGEGVFVGYRYYDSKKVVPLFPFGHGLSYTHFTYGGASVTAGKNDETPVEIAVTVANDGPRTGADVVQLYIRDVQSSETRPFQELKAFRKVRLDAGAHQTIHFPLSPRSFSFYDDRRHQWVCEPGEFVARIGNSSRDIRLQQSFKLDANCRLTAGS